MGGYTFLPQAYLRGKFIPFSEATISIATHALHYGTAAYGGMRVFPNPKKPGELILFRLEDHCRRLSDSARFLHFSISAQRMQDIVLEFLRINKPTTSVYLRSLVYSSGLEIVPKLHGLEKDFLLYGLELGDYLSGEGVTCCFSSWMRQMDASFPLRGKITGAYITSCLAKTEAVDRGFDEGILINSQGKVCEGTGMNIFIVRKGQVITPGVEQDILEGITRDSVMKIIKDLGYLVVERAIDKSELLIADEVFLTGTAARITPVSRIENYSLPTEKPITSKVKELFSSAVEGRAPVYESWLTRLVV